LTQDTLSDKGGIMIHAQPNSRGWSFVPGLPVVRGYDSSPLSREDCLLRKHLQMEVDADLKQMEQEEKELAAIEERLSRMKKERGWID